MKNSTRIICPNCEQLGIKQTIGVVLDNGMVSIQRGYYKPGYREFTYIKGDNFTLVCGKCSNEVFIRKGGKNADNSSFGEPRVHRFTFSETVIRLGTQGTGSFA